MPTDMMVEVLGGTEAPAEFLDLHPIRRIATLEEVADLVGFLAGPSAGYITGSVIASSPLSTRKFSGTLRQTSQICRMFPEASLTATMFGIAASRTSVAGSTLQPVRPGTL